MQLLERNTSVWLNTVLERVRYQVNGFWKYRCSTSPLFELLFPRRWQISPGSSTSPSFVAKLDDICCLRPSTSLCQSYQKTGGIVASEGFALAMFVARLQGVSVWDFSKKSFERQVIPSIRNASYVYYRRGPSVPEICRPQQECPIPGGEHSEMCSKLISSSGSVVRLKMDR